MVFIDRISDSQDPREVFALLNEFIGTLKQVGRIRGTPLAVRPAQIASAYDLKYWLRQTSHELKQRKEAGDGVSDELFWLNAVLQVAAKKLRASW